MSDVGSLVLHQDEDGIRKADHDFLVIYIFMACGFEHSIANMSVMAVGLLNGAGVEGVSIAGYFHNLLWVTLGNIAGGALLVAFPYYIIQKEKK